MAGLIGKAKGLWQRDKAPAAEAPPPFSVRCLCGEPMEGYRRRESQSLTCPACSQKIFVFPRTALPPVANRKQASGKAKETAPTPANAPASRGGSDAKVAAPRRTMHRGHSDESVEQDLTADDFRTLRQPFWTRPKLIFAGVAFVVIAAIWFQVDRSQRARLREQLLPSGTEGMKLLASGKFEDAANKLEVAVRAMDRLREPVPDEALFRHGYEQAVLLRDAPGEPLDYQLTLAPKDPELVARVIHERPFIMDATLELTAEQGFRVAWHQFIEEQPVRIDATALTLLKKLGIDKSTRLVFGAKFDKLIKEEDGSWRLTLLPESGVLITEASVFALLGADEEQRKRQKAMLEKLTGAPSEK